MNEQALPLPIALDILFRECKEAHVPNWVRFSDTFLREWNFIYILTRYSEVGVYTTMLRLYLIKLLRNEFHEQETLSMEAKARLAARYN